MAMDLKSILETMKKTYSFRVKIAADITDENLKNVDTILNVKGMTKRTKPEALPLASTPYDFPRLQGFLEQFINLKWILNIQLLHLKLLMNYQHN